MSNNSQILEKAEKSFIYRINVCDNAYNGQF